MAGTDWRRRLRPRLVSLLLGLNVLILLLPLAGIGLLRLYESALVRQTESELIAQGAVLAASFRALADPASEASDPLQGRRPAIEVLPPGPDARWRPRPPRLDLMVDPVAPPAPDPQPAAIPASASARRRGARLAPILVQAQQVTLAGLRVVDVQGVVIATTGQDLGLSWAALPEVQAALLGDTVSSLRVRQLNSLPAAADQGSGSAIRVWVGLPILEEGQVVGAVVLARTPVSLGNALAPRRGLLIGALLSMLLLCGILTYLCTRLIIAPVRALIRQAKRTADGEAEDLPPLSHYGTREIAELHGAVASMAGSLQQRSRYIQDFAAQVSHELKTPITAIGGAAELLREHGAAMAPAQQRHFLDIIADDAQRMDRLVRRLLELVRADGLRPATEHCDAGAVVRAVARRCQQRGQAVETLGAESAMAVAIAAEILESVLSQLIDNALVHGGADVRVRLELWREADEGCLAVQDDGPGVPSADRERIFEPFFTTGRNAGCTGMGLSIAGALLRAHRGHLALQESAKGARLVLRLPLAG